MKTWYFNNTQLWIICSRSYLTLTHVTFDLDPVTFDLEPNDIWPQSHMSNPPCKGIENKVFWHYDLDHHTWLGYKNLILVYCGQVSSCYLLYFPSYELFSSLNFGQVTTDEQTNGWTESNAYEPTVHNKWFRQSKFLELRGYLGVHIAQHYDSREVHYNIVACRRAWEVRSPANPHNTGRTRQTNPLAR